MELCDVAAERAVLAGLYCHGRNAYDDIADLITPGTFGADTNAVIFKIFQHGLEKSPGGKLDLATVMASANDLGLKWVLQGENQLVLRAIMNLHIELSNVRRMAGKIGKLAHTRVLGRTVEEAKNNLLKVTGDEPMSHILGLVEKPIFDYSMLLNTTQDNEPRLIGDGLRDWLTYIESNPTDQVGISSGFATYDKAIGGGLRRKTVNVIGARPKTGKTLFAAAVAKHVAGNLKIPVLMLDTEMSREDQWVRLLAKLSRVEIDDIETGKYASDSEKKCRINEAATFLENAPFMYLSIAGQPFEETISVMRRWVTRTVGFQDNGRPKDCLIVFDYLKMMSSEGISEAMKEYQILGFMMTGLHNFVHRHDLPCLAFVQLNRDGDDKEKTTVVSQSDRIIWLCSNFSIYKKKSDEEIAKELQEGFPKCGTRKLVPMVARHGAGIEDGDYICYRFEGQYANIEELGSWNDIRKTQKNDFQVIDQQQTVDF